jgi:hypothetical protein
LAEHILGKDEVTGSIPVVSSRFAPNAPRRGGGVVFQGIGRAAMRLSAMVSERWYAVGRRSSFRTTRCVLSSIARGACGGKWPTQIETEAAGHVTGVNGGLAGAAAAAGSTTSAGRGHGTPGAVTVPDAPPTLAGTFGGRSASGGVQ